MSVRVLSYPPVHNYVNRLHDVSAELVHRNQPWPALPDLYDPDWLRRHRTDWDLTHLHFTWEQYPPDRVDEVLRTHRGTGTPVVWTAHDLRNPHTDDPGRDQLYLDLLAEHADHVITLTAGAADEIADRFGRRAQVIPHGPLLSSPASRWWRRTRRKVLADLDGRTRLLLHLRSVRANVDWWTPMAVGSDLHRQGTPVALDVDLERAASAREAVRAAAGAGVEVYVHDPMPHEDLVRRMIAADALILPYRWGTHSGMVELAADLAVPVIATDVGYLHEQAPAWTVPVVADVLDRAVLADRVRDIADGRRPPTVGVDERERDVLRFRNEHAALYDRLRDTASGGSG